MHWAAVPKALRARRVNRELAAVGSGDPADVGSFYLPTRTSYLGRAVAIVRPGEPGSVPILESVRMD